MKKTCLKQVGVTESGQKVFAGVYDFFSTNGLPLDVLFNLAVEQGWIPCWASFYEEAKAAGMRHDRILSKMEEAICDSFGSEYAQVVIERLNKKFQPKD